MAEDGYIRLPTAPGLGVEMNEAAMLQRAYGEFPLRHIRQYGEERP